MFGLPNPDLVVRLSIEELAGVMLPFLRGQTSFSPHNICCGIDNSYGQHPQMEECKEAVMEAIGWMFTEGLVALDPSQSGNGFMRVSRRGRMLNSSSDLTQLAQRDILPKAFLHPIIAQEAKPIFQAGKYGAAVYEAFKQVEIAVKQTSGLSSIGAALMKQAFASKGGTLTDVTADGGEQEGIMFVFAGAMQLFRNATGHNNVVIEPARAAALIIHASTLMYLVDESRVRSNSLSKLTVTMSL